MHHLRQIFVPPEIGKRHDCMRGGPVLAIWHIASPLCPVQSFLELVIEKQSQRAIAQKGPKLRMVRAHLHGFLEIGNRLFVSSLIGK